MPRLRIIVLDSPGSDQAARTSFRLALWADVPAARQPFYAAAAGANAQSAWIGALPADNTALQNGSVTERVVILNPDGTRTLAQVQSDAIAAATAFQTEINAFNKWPRYGTTWDGTTWVVASIP